MQFYIKKEVWINDGYTVVSIPSKNVDEEVLKENTMENYIVINGKKAELTEDQLKQLGIEVEKESEEKMDTPFNSELKEGDIYFVITTDEGVKTSFYDSITDKHRLNNVNSFNDKDFAKQVYLHELLNRKLLKYAYDNNAEDCEWNWNGKQHYYIFFDYSESVFTIAHTTICKNQGVINFSKQEIAELAIEDVVKPFIEEHPEFIW